MVVVPLVAVRLVMVAEAKVCCWVQLLPLPRFKEATTAPVVGEITRVPSVLETEYTAPVPALMQAGFSAEDANTVIPNRGKGCEKCNNTGYKGRVGLYELLHATPSLRHLIRHRSAATEYLAAGVAEGMAKVEASRQAATESTVSRPARAEPQG